MLSKEVNSSPGGGGFHWHREAQRGIFVFVECGEMGLALKFSIAMNSGVAVSDL